MSVRAIRGAITVDENTKEQIINKTKQLLVEIIQSNDVSNSDMVSIFFTVTNDITAAFPPVAARELGLANVPLMTAVEMEVPGSLPKCIRVMLHLNSDKSLDEIKHVYLGNAKKLRPDLAE
ncbi:chorismate mutase [Petroclostridium sp. X23]|jgi:chorismate mutase|uniref:chorismate mutase n=1 Tax=Petroclostridium sp. X23 TaxID=3045146 RepID=UPI0024AD7517|nr:chorismate mutase [Petroclostridium sp. X23]WHH59461.1 chorismate mutase [Petroclostridium sp. X23]